MKMLLVVDMLNDFIDPKGALFYKGHRDIIPEVMRAIEEHRGDPIIFLCDAHDENDKEFERFPKHAVIETWGAEIIPELDVQNITTADIILKSRYSGFYGTPLEKLLDIYRPSEVEICGVCTSICVMDTVGGLVNRDYKTIIVTNRVSDFNIANHFNALNRMEQLYGTEIISPY